MFSRTGVFEIWECLLLRLIFGRSSGRELCAGSEASCGVSFRLGHET